MNKHVSEKGVVFLQSKIGLRIAMQFHALDFLTCSR